MVFITIICTLSLYLLFSYCIERIKSVAKDNQDQANLIAIAQRKHVFGPEASKYVTNEGLSRLTAAASVKEDQEARLDLLASAAVSVAAAPTAGGMKQTTTAEPVSATAVDATPLTQPGAAFKPCDGGSVQSGSAQLAIKPVVLSPLTEPSVSLSASSSTAAVSDIEVPAHEPNEIFWTGGGLTRGEPVVNTVQFWNGERIYTVHRFSLSNHAASSQKLQYSDEPLEVFIKYCIQLYNWWNAGAVFKAFEVEREGLQRSRPFLSRCVVYDKKHKNFDTYIVQVMMTTCNKPIVGFYVCDLVRYRAGGWMTRCFQILRTGELLTVILWLLSDN